MKAVTLADIARVDWEYLVNRRQTPLCCSLTEEGDTQFRRHTGLPLDPKHYLHTLSDGVYMSRSERAEMHQVFFHGGVLALREFRRRLIRATTNLEWTAIKIERLHPETLSRLQLVRHLKFFGAAATAAHPFLNSVAVADRFLTEMVLDRLPTASAAIHASWLRTFTYPAKENSHVHEQRAFLRLVVIVRRRPVSLRDLARTHAQEWGWIGGRNYFWHLAWTQQDVVERVRVFLRSGQSPLRALHHLNAVRHQHAADFQTLVRKLHIRSGSNLAAWIALAREFAFLRTWRTDVIYRSGYRARGVFYEVARRAGLRQHDVGWLLWREAVAMAKTGRVPISAKVLADRKRFVAIVTHHGKIVGLGGAVWRRRLLPLLPYPGDGQEVRGTTAYAGRVRGRVKVVFWVKDLPKVKPGDILVAVMTFPHFVPAMEKAAAFVTDEGGILCHAAIVAREMRKPCIIGTKNATRLLKDGDRVEVDAEKGIVRRI